MDNTTKVLTASYQEAVKTVPTMFLSSFFGKNSEELYVSDQEKIEIDIKRDEEMIAIDVLRGGSANTNVAGRYSTKEYSPPLYDESVAITAGMLNKRRAGMTPYERESRELRFAGIAVESLMKATRKILRAIEKQTAEALFDGVVTLVNTESLDFKRKASHNITPADLWSDTVNANPIADLKAACEVNRVDGKVASKAVIMGSEAWDNFIVHPKVTEYLDNRRIEGGLIDPQFGAEGATFQGIIWIGDYRLELYTYPQFYTSDEGSTHTPYVPTDQVVVMDPTARLDKAFAAVEVLPQFNKQFNGLGLGAIPQLTASEFVPYQYNQPPKSLIVGVQSAPLVIPTAIDTICNLNVL